MLRATSAVAVALVAVLSATLAGCTADERAAVGATSSPAPAADAKPALAAATAGLGAGRYFYKVDLGQGRNGRVTVDHDAGAQLASVTIDDPAGTMTIDVYDVGQDERYLKFDMSEIASRPQIEGFDGTTWLRVDPARSEDLIDPVSQIIVDWAVFEESLKTVEQRTAHTFTGTVNLKTLHPHRFGTPTSGSEEVATRRAPFRAETDTEGRLLGFAADVTVTGVTTTMTVSFGHDIGTLPPVPAAGTYADAPESLYKLDLSAAR
ncbi:hypothetical protein J2S43_006251 [Catenuloplanes nepalensis]|uniref:Lipoprotein n=1 Tax=Catenuloplanes nepalensis TaxID=587533 RepID=A0ABT9N215_9ACTN|nr:hypothetical protein [Catenuloplanes nepalensis]MDP9797739.1 hypothetical protein [Catenuloplanes nepalensis]